MGVLLKCDPVVQNLAIGSMIVQSDGFWSALDANGLLLADYLVVLPATLRSRFNEQASSARHNAVTALSRAMNERE